MTISGKRAGQVGSIAAGVVAFGLTMAVMSNATTNSGQMVVASSDPANTQQPVPVLEIGTVPVILTPQDISFPLDEYRPDSAAENAVLAAEHQLTKDCMSRFDMPFDEPVWSVAAEHSDYDRLFSVINLDEVKEFGYHLPGEAPSASGLGNAQSGGGVPAGVSEADYMAAFMGESDSVNGQKVPSGGCIGEARAILGDDYALQFLIEEGVNYALTQSNADARVIEAFAAWSTCMANAGYQYATPSDAINDPKWNIDADIAPSAEIDTAVADVTCKIDTNLTGIRVAVATAWQEQFIQDHAEELAAATAQFEKQRATAETIG